MNDSVIVNKSKSLAPDRYLEACPIRYKCRSLFIYLLEMEYCPENDRIEVLLNYPEKNDPKYFTNDSKLQTFISDVKKFAFPYIKLSQSSANSSRHSTSLVQFYTFVLTDANRIRQYGFCRSAQNGKHILCIISYLPWYNVFINILNKISSIINEKDTKALYHFLEALYEYELPEPGNFAQIFSHDGLDQIRFMCPDRRVVPSIQENRNLLKFFAFFDLDKLKKIFTALLLERSILVVSKDLENLTSCGLSFEYLMYPLEWLHTFVPIVPEHIDSHIFNQPFPFIYGVHTTIYQSLNKSQLDNCIILLLDDRQILNADKDQLPVRVNEYLTRKLDYFKQSDDFSFNSSSKTQDLLSTGPLRPFQESVLMIIDDYREYIVYNDAKQEFKFDESNFFKLKNVSTESTSQKYHSNENEFYHEFRVTQAFEEFCRDRAEYLDREKNSLFKNVQFQKDFIDILFDQYISERSKITSIIDKKLRDFKNKAKEKSSNLKTNFIKTRNQFIKKSSSIDNELVCKVHKSKVASIETKPDSSDQEVSSSSSTSSLCTLPDEPKLSEKRFTLDLSNDPDIKKYFEDNFSDKPDEDLIDISDTSISTKMADHKLNKLENFFDDLLLSEQKSETWAKSSEDNSLKSILNEFDPMCEPNKLNATAPKPIDQLINQFSNLTPKPFQPASVVKTASHPVPTVSTPSHINTFSNRPVQLNPYTPTPFYSSFNQYNHLSGYRPVNFQITSKPVAQMPIVPSVKANNVDKLNFSFEDDFDPNKIL